MRAKRGLCKGEILDILPAMNHLPIDTSRDPEPIRLFKSDFLEFFTHISPITIIIIWLPFAGYMLIREIIAGIEDGQALWYVLAAFLIGLFLWTLSEYLLHRFLFHHQANGKVAERIFYLFHGVHHHQPQCKTRLVMPPVVSIPLATIFYGLFTLVMGSLFQAPQWVGPMVSGFTIGYLIYDLTHYATHHFPMRSGIGKYLKRYHMQHHYKTPDKRFGVSSPLWDVVFGTKPV
jgi:sterol desaturase/sphingolipid hydroxylase (fatty acid hydroxylase superfamily)